MNNSDAGNKILIVERKRRKGEPEEGSYGLMDAAAMVDLALNWTNVPPQRVCEAQAPMTGDPITIRQMSKENLALTTDGCESAAALAGDLSHRVVHLEHVQAKSSCLRKLPLVTKYFPATKLIDEHNKMERFANHFTETSVHRCFFPTYYS
uniref:Uncharacterized protein n=1 Tax=Schistosoma haematobium TaxID=6185 RepID=A0A095A1W0_SCHHA